MVAVFSWGTPAASRPGSAKSALFLVLLALALAAGTLYAPAAFAQRHGDAAQAATAIDQMLEQHWKQQGVEPAEPCDDATFLRRVTLDLAGRIPTPSELEAFLKDKDADKRAGLIARRMDDPEFALHFGKLLDRWIQDSHQGNEQFVDYLRISLRRHKPWDQVFREIMVGPWDDEQTRPANRFLDRRAKTLDTLTSDTARVFFGVDISCAKCHDHPLVDDWTQEHFYGMAAFLNRTTGGKGQVGEKDSGEVTFLAADGEEKTARMMFLSGQKLDEPATADEAAGESSAADRSSFTSRRRQLVEIALQERRFFSRALVNRVWQYLFGRGLVEPVDQMHSGNPAAVPELLDWLARDFADRGYDLHSLVESLVRTRAYQLSSRWDSDAPLPAADTFAVARLRPLGRGPLALSLLLATGDGSFGQPADEAARRAERLLSAEGLGRVERYLELEGEAESLARVLDPAQAEFQSSTTEALFLSNAEVVQQRIRAAGGNLAERLANRESTAEILREAFRTTLSRLPDEQEEQQLSEWFDAQQQDRRETCEQLVWALITSAEFRFNH